MTDKSTESDGQPICKTCGKRIPDTDRKGSITSYLFQPFLCSCDSIGSRLHQENLAPPSAGTSNKVKTSSGEFCPVCGLQRSANKQGGSITAFLFEGTRCKCQPSLQALDEQMAERFWKLKQTDAGKTFSTQAGSGNAANKSAGAKINALTDAIIGNSYRIIRAIGRGGMGEVYLAKHLTLGKTCALKLIPPDQVTDIIWQRFQNEAKTIAALEHVNLVKVTDLGIHEGCLPYYAMEYIEGQTLGQVLMKRGAMPLPAVLEIFKQVCDGLDYAHRKGIIHRDLKPGNIMLARSKTSKYAVKILDFGLVKTIQKDRHQQSLTRVGEVFGTPLYMSPEQCMSEKVDNRSDIYSVGCTMFECLTGRPPFLPETPIDLLVCHTTLDPPTLASVVGPDVLPESMEVILAKLLRKNPVERYQTLSELRQDLVRVQKGEPVEPFYLSRNRPGKTMTTLKAQKKKEQEGAGEERSEKDNKGDKGRRKDRRGGGSIDTSRRDGRERAMRSGSQPPASLTAAVVATIVLTLLLGTATIWFMASKLGSESSANNGHVELSSLPVDVPAAESKTTIDGATKTEGTRSKGVKQATVFGARTATPGGVPLSCFLKSPFARLTEVKGRQVRVFTFPTDVMLGCVRKTSGPSIEAKGTVIFSADDRVTFVPFPDVLKYPVYLTRFRAGDIYEIKPESPANIADTAYPGSDKALKLASAIPGVHSLNLNNCEDLTDKSMDSINCFKDLTDLYLTDNLIAPAALAKLSRINQMRLFSLQGYPEVGPLLDALKASTGIKKLFLEHTHLTLGQVAIIASMPNLEQLECDQITPSNRDTTIKALELLNRNSKITKFMISTMPMSSEAISLLKNFKQISTLKIDPVSSGLTPRLTIELKKALPEVLILDMRHRNVSRI